jgi:hypothetical protein
MNNDLYHWHSQQTVRYEMREVDRAVAQSRLLREAGFSGPDWLTRPVTALGNLLQARAKEIQAHWRMKPNALPRKSPESA